MKPHFITLERFRILSPQSPLPFFKLTAFLLLIPLIFFSSGSIHAYEIQIGSGTLVTGSSSASPVNIYYRSQRAQFVYTAAELTNAGASPGFITQLGFFIASAPIHSLPNYTIRMGHTAQSNAATHNTATTAIVFQQGSYSPTPGDFDMLTLSSPFFWNGSDNLLVDICFDMVPSWSSSGTVRYSSETDSYIYTWSDGSNQCGEVTNTPVSSKPQIKFELLTPAPVDAGLSGFNSPQMPFSAGSQQVSVNLFNYGSNNLTSATIQWEVNGSVQTPVSWTGNLALANSEIVNLGSINFQGGTTYNLKAWTELPNGVQDTININDTIALQNLAPSLSGVYIIGGSMPDYSTLNAAVEDLKTKGASGTVTFRLRNGNHSGRVLIKAWPGMSSSNNLVIESESGDSSLATLTVSGTWDSNYVVRVEDASFITIRRITLSNPDTFNGTVLSISGNCQDIEVSNCQLFGVVQYSFSSSLNIVNADYGFTGSLSFLQNVFSGGYRGISILGDYLGQTTIAVENNSIKDFTVEGIYLEGPGLVTITGNDISSASLYSGKMGIYADYVYHRILCEKNRIYLENLGYGLYIYSIISLNGDTSLFANNFIYVAQGTSGASAFDSYGFYGYDLNHTLIGHNTILQDVTNISVGYCLYLSGWQTNLSVLNNIFHNAGAGSPAIFYTLPDHCDYNNYYNQQYSVLISDDQTSYSNLTTWSQASSLDNNSKSVNSGFATFGEPDVTAIFLNNSGFPISQITDDFYGNPRNLTLPDIGAVEFSPPALDAALSNIISPQKPLPPGLQPITVELTNGGLDTLVSATINWVMNGTPQTPYSWSGSLLSGNSIGVTLANYTFSPGTTYDFIAWVSSPNGGTDSNPSNDSVFVTGLKTALAGVYTIGGSLPDYASFGLAIDDLNELGIYGPVTFNIRNGVYTEQITLGSVAGSSDSIRITFQSESGDNSLVTLEFGLGGFSTNYVILFENAFHYSIKDITISRPISSTYSRVVGFKDQVGDIILEGNRIFGGVSVFSSAYEAAVIGTDYATNLMGDIHIVNNVITGGSIGVLADCYGSANKISPNIESNAIHDYYSRGIFLYETEQVSVHHNFLSSASSFFSLKGIHLAGNSGGGVIANRIFGHTIGYPIHLESNNQGSPPALESPPASFTDLTVANNFIEFSGTGYVYLAYNDDLRFVYNSLHKISGADVAFYSIGGTGNHHLNNIIMNSAGPPAAQYFFPSGFTINHNNYYSTGPVLLKLSSTGYSSLSAWQTATSHDAASLAVDPGFAGPGDLHVSNSMLNGAATPLAFITEDIDGDTRSPVTPDIGADEFTPNPDDVELYAIVSPIVPFPADTLPIKVVLFNNGGNDIDSVKIHWSINGVYQGFYHYQDVILPQMFSDSITLGTFGFLPGIEYNLVAFTSEPNGTTDTNPANDTLAKPGLYAALSGLYTIGGPSPDFPNFSSAVTALHQGGMLSSVQFSVRNGVYNERISFGSIPGNTSANTIEFFSQTGDSSQVKLDLAAASSSENYLVRFAGTQDISFRDISFLNTGATFSRNIEFTGTNNRITFRGCNFSSPATTSGSADRMLVYGASLTGSDIEFIKCAFFNGGYAVYLTGVSAGSLVDVRVDSCKAQNQYGGHVYLFRAVNPIIRFNHFSRAASSTGISIRCATCTGTGSVFSNTIEAPGHGYGIYFDSFTGISNARTLIANNMISIGDWPGYGIFLSSASFVNVYYNTVRNGYSSASSRAFNVSGGNVNVVNNIFSNQGTGYAYYYGSGTIPTSDFNNLHTNGSNIGFASGNRAALSDFQSATGRDANSISVDPLFVSSTDIHVSEIALNGAATPLTEVTTDIDGEIRNSLNPDIGADEFEPPAYNDAGLIAITQPVTPFACGPNDVLVTLKNFGALPLTQVSVNWQVNNVLQPVFNWTGNLASGHTTSVNIGSFSFVPLIYYSINAWTSSPNGVLDSIPINDSTTRAGILCALSGIYTIGGTSPDFANFNQAVAALTGGGVSGPVTFNVRPGVYSEQIDIPVISGASSVNRITFQSENGDSASVTLSFNPSGSANNFTVRLSGADYLTFRRMTLASGAGYYSRIVVLNSGCDDIHLTNNRFSTGYTGHAGDNSALIFSASGQTNHGLQILQNRFENATHGVLIYGNSSINLGTNTLVRNNHFTGQRSAALSLYYQSNPMVQANQVDFANGSFYGQSGIRLIYCNAGFTVSENKILMNYQGYGIMLESNSCNSGSPGLVYNNFVADTGKFSYTYGIYLSYNSHVYIYFNNVKLQSTQNLSYGLSFFGNSSLRIANNNLVNDGPGYAVYGGFGSELLYSDYNNIYSPSGKFAYLNSADVNDLAAWKTASSKDVNSLSTDPLYVSSTDLHVRSAMIDSAGTSIAGITTDIDGETRNSATPDIGADEFNNFNNDIGISLLVSPVNSCSNGPGAAVTVRIRNFGGFAQSGFNVGFSFNNGAPVIENVGGLTVAPGGHSDFTFAATVDVSFLGTYSLKAWTLLPADDFPSNDTLSSTFTSYPAMTYGITNSQSICAGNGLFVSASGGGSYLWSNGVTWNTFYASPTTTTTYSVTITSPIGCTVTDSVTINVNPLPATPAVTPSGNQTICFGDSLLLTSSVATNLLWSTGATTQSIYVSSNNAYYVTHREPFTNCATVSNTVYVTVTTPVTLTTASGSDTICLGDNATISVNNAVFYSWSTGATTASINVSPVTTTTYSVTATNASSCVYSLSKTIAVVTQPIPGTVGSMLPSNNSIGLTLPINFSWAPSTNTIRYDLYIWPSGQSQPGTPTVANLSQISHQYQGSLVYGETYNWRVVSKNSCNSASSVIQTFSVRELPDLIVESVSLPATAFSGQNVSVSWVVKNTGSGSTLNAQWYDHYYLSPDPVLDLGVDILLGAVINSSALQSNQAYTTHASFNLPNGISGIYYVIVVANGYNHLLESSTANNQGYNNVPMTVFLTPPPDLAVTSIVTPFNSFSGSNINVTWEVKNQGTGSTIAGVWSDRVYLSTDSVFTLATATNKATVIYNSGPLLPDSSYSKTASISLPNGVFGTYYVYVTTDIHNQVFEHAWEANNTSRSGPINVILTPPPDLVVSSVSAPSSASNNSIITVSWTGMNQGGGDITSVTWADRVSLSTDPNSPVNPVVLGSKFIFSPLIAGDSYSTSGSYNVPVHLNGTWYVYVTTNATNTVYEHVYTTNNITRCPDSLVILAPDLTIGSVTAPGTVNSGQSATISWVVKNMGPGHVLNRSRVDRIMISSSAIYDPNQMTEVSTISYNVNINAGDSITRTASVNVPNGLSGTYYFYIYTDYNQVIFETDETNNTGRSAAVQAVLPPWPDLTFLQVSYPDTVFAGDAIQISATIKNIGSGATPFIQYRDKFYFSNNPTWNTSASILRQFIQQRVLQADSTYEISSTVLMSASLSPGTYYFHFYTDQEDKIYEHTGEGNNLITSGPIVVLGYPPVDLEVTSVSGPASGASGQSVTMSWTTRNNGPARTLSALWNDAIYLSTDTVFSPGTDIFVKDWTRNGALNAGESYSQTRTFNLPNGISGNYYLLAVADRNNFNQDADFSNNSKAWADTSGGGFSPLNITLTPPSDLVVSSFNPPATGTSGQPVTISWAVQNQGTGATSSITWADRIYLSTDFNLDGNDVILGTKIRSGGLPAGNSYSDSITVNLPVNASGSYILLIKTDANDVEYEHNGEHNNISSSYISISQPPPCDLIVDAVSFPATVTAGDMVTVDVTLKNIGANPATGYSRTAVYFSNDSEWDSGDPLHKSIQTYLSLAPGASVTYSLTERLPGLASGQYHVVAVADLMNNIFESNDTNNTLVSATTMELTVPLLPLYTWVSNTLNNAIPLYYRIEVPDSLVGESLLVTLLGDSASGHNELYLRHEDIPSRSVHDYAHSSPFSGNQSVIIPQLQPGVYYVLVYGTRPGSNQPISLYARKLGFEIHAITASVVGNTGTATVRIDGSKFQPGIEAYLQDSANFILSAVEVNYVNPTTIFVTWNMRSGNYSVADSVTGESWLADPLEPGFYTVRLVNPDFTSVEKDSGLQVVSSTGPVLYSNILFPAATAPGRIISMSLQFANAGNVDLPRPERTLVAKDGAPVAFSVSDLAAGQTDLPIEFTELGGPPDVLRPGAYSTVTVYSKAIARLRFILINLMEE